MRFWSKGAGAEHDVTVFSKVPNTTAAPTTTAAVLSKLNNQPPTMLRMQPIITAKFLMELEIFQINQFNQFRKQLKVLHVGAVHLQVLKIVSVADDLSNVPYEILLDSITFVWLNSVNDTKKSKVSRWDAPTSMSANECKLKMDNLT